MRPMTAVVAGLLALSGCGDGSSSTTETASSRPPTSTSTTIGMAVVPDVVGKDLAAARATLAAAGFTRLTANDGTQQDRVPGDDWIVHSQSPSAGDQALTSGGPLYLELLQAGDRYQNPGTSPCPRFAQC